MHPEGLAPPHPQMRIAQAPLSWGNKERLRRTVPPRDNRRDRERADERPCLLYYLT